MWSLTNWHHCICTKNVNRKFGDFLVILTPPQLADGRIRTRLTTIHKCSERAVSKEAHDFYFGMCLCKTLTNVWITCHALFFCKTSELVKFATERNAADSCCCTTLVTKQCHCNHPAAIDFTNNVFLRATCIGEEHLVELRVTRHHLDRTHFNARLTHVHQQERDTAVLHFVWCRSCKNKDVVCEVTCRCPDLLTINDPLITVENCTTTEVAQVGTCCRF
ncbi:unannotated protein [freshwater metagenome]|uniref:Unannotated protein n=1 Tax=freshwater metagenome TaxID=449393 RepID=A0A6J6HV59_9ZZZZ